MFHKSFLKIMTPAGPSPQPHTHSPHPSPFNSEVSSLKPRAHLSVLLLLPTLYQILRWSQYQTPTCCQTWRDPRWESHHSFRPWNFISLFRKVVLSVRFVIVGHRSAFHSFLIRGEMGGRYLKRFQGCCCRHKASVFLNILGPAK